MIYKLKCANSRTTSMEVEKIDENHISISISDFDEKNMLMLYIDKEDLYYLKGILHLLHKEME
jgi:hypothetical protein